MSDGRALRFIAAALVAPLALPALGATIEYAQFRALSPVTSSDWLALGWYYAVCVVFGGPAVLAAARARLSALGCLGFGALAGVVALWAEVAREYWSPNSHDAVVLGEAPSVAGMLASFPLAAAVGAVLGLGIAAVFVVLAGVPWRKPAAG